LGAFTNKNVAKINDASICASTLKYVMCNANCLDDKYMDAWAKGECETLMTKFPCHFGRTLRQNVFQNKRCGILITITYQM